MRNTRRWAPALALCLLLTACGGGEDGGTPSPLETAANLDGSTVLLTVDGREVPAWRYLYWLAYTCGQLADRYAAADLPLDWDAPAETGTLAESAKAQALADTALYATVENWAETYGCAPAETEGESPLPDLGLSEAQMEELAAVGRQYAALRQLAQDPESPLAPEAADLTAYGRETGAVTLDRILVATGEDRTVARQEAEALFLQLNGAEDPAGTFSTLAAAGDDPAGPRTVLPGDGTLDEALLEAAGTLAEGQTSGILESEEGFSILRRLALDTAALEERYFDDRLESAAAQAAVTVTAAYETLDPAAFWDALSLSRAEG